MKNNKSISHTFFLNATLVTFIPLIVIIFIMISHTFKDFHEDVNRNQDSYINNQKYLIQLEVKKIVFYIESMNKHFKNNNQNYSLKKIQQEVLENIVDKRFGKEGYFFGSMITGNPLFSNGVITKGGDNLLDLTDPNGIKIIREQIRMVSNPEGGFVKYSWRKLGDEKIHDKISFVISIPEWEWIIGAGVYLDEIDLVVLKEKNILKDELTADIITSISIFILLITFLIFTVKHFSAKIKNNFEIFDSFLKKAEVESITINKDDLHFKEFESLAVKANQMIESRKIAEDKLTISHNNLEELVKKRTAELEDKNKDLEQLNDTFVGREYRIKELRDEIKQLKDNIN